MILFFCRLLSTPGLPDLIEDEDIEDEKVLHSFGNFRRQTLLRYLDASQQHSPEFKAKLLDWKPEVLENKTRHQTTKAREVTAYKEIFGLELSGVAKKSSSSGRQKSKATSEKKAVSTPVKEPPSISADETLPLKGPEKGRKSSIKKGRKSAVAAATTSTPASSRSASEKSGSGGPKSEAAPARQPSDDAMDDEEGPISEEAEELQTELQTYALDLLDTNASWERRTVIQNLVIWEPVTDPALLALPPGAVVPGTVAGSSVNVNVPPSKTKKTKKTRKRQSGLDFSRKRPTGKNSRDVSRAHSPDPAETDSRREILWTLSNILNDSKHMVMDKSAGETILHRAAKMGYPDVAAYALDMAKMNPTIKDNAGFPPIHKAALKGHAEILDYLIRYVESVC